MAGILSGPIDAPPEDRLAKVYPKVEAVAGMALSHRASGFSGVLVRVEGGGVEIRGRTGLERVFRLAPGAFSVDGRAVSLVRPATRPAAGGRPPGGDRLGVGGRGRRPGPGGPGRSALGGGRPRCRAGRAGVGRRPAHRRGGGGAAGRHRPSGRGDQGVPSRSGPQARRAGRPPGRRQQGVAHRLRPAPPPGADHRHPLRRRLGGGEAVGAGHRRLAPDPAGVSTGRPACARRSGSAIPPTTWKRILASVSSYADLEPALVGAVERLIDFVTDPN